jgi:hypothetical protein
MPVTRSMLCTRSLWPLHVPKVSIDVTRQPVVPIPEGPLDRGLNFRESSMRIHRSLGVDAPQLSGEQSHSAVTGRR